jgi:hypothetical protein
VGNKRSDEEVAADVASMTRHYADEAERLVRNYADELRVLAEREDVDLSDPQTRRIVAFVIETLDGNEDASAQLRAVRAWISLLTR